MRQKPLHAICSAAAAEMATIDSSPKVPLAKTVVASTPIPAATTICGGLRNDSMLGCSYSRIRWPSSRAITFGWLVGSVSNACTGRRQTRFESGSMAYCAMAP